MKDASYLQHLGEFATLKNAIGGWFHQDAFLDFGSDDEIFEDIGKSHDAEVVALLVEQLSSLLEREDDIVRAVWDENSHSHSFHQVRELREYLISMREILQRVLAQQSAPADGLRPPLS